MTKLDMAALNETFGMISTLEIMDVSGMPVIRVSTPLACARIALQGGQVLEWQPAGHLPVLWVSRKAVYEQGRGVRGGVPVCWPWFGAGQPGQPAHGFVRTRMWQLRETSWHGDVLLVRLGIHDDAETRALWDHAFDLELRLTIGRTLTIELITHNRGEHAFDITDALHTYFHVGNILRTKVSGLDQVSYFDKVLGIDNVLQHGPIRIEGETDRIYHDTDATCVIADNALDRRISVAKSGSHSTVVWNPWVEKTRGFADMQSEEYRQMLCVETCNAGDDVVTVAPGHQHSLTAIIGVVMD